ncbi:ankyrin repeat-containing domain protein [Sphaerosporella brunnea]|uniref:Ankyrin repeat-containing domain protein n=1 Tax=Sphaerosporella brunnea TaxID=1250544 RepID=A0A5J5F9X8_9PEZI|nr:ankyrin repeat-containing domain protein [Sphaerosporella brunnea]
MSPTTPYPPLPTEIFLAIGDLLEIRDLSALSRTCWLFRYVFTLPLFRRVRESLSTSLFRIMQSNNNVRLLTYLLDEGLPVDCTMNTGTNPTPLVSTLLHFAAYSGSDALVRLLLDRGADVSAATTRNTDAQVQRAIANDSEALGADAGSTALHIAGKYGREVVATLLIDNGAVVCAAAEDGSTPLHWAVCGGHQAMSELLISKGADVSAVDRCGRRPLHYAALEGHAVVCELLISKGANVSIADSDRFAPIHYAAMSGRASVARLLIEKGASVSALAFGGLTPMCFATSETHWAVRQVLLDSSLASAGETASLNGGAGRE